MTEKTIIWLIVVAGLALLSLIWIFGTIIKDKLKVKAMALANESLKFPHMLELSDEDSQEIMEKLKNIESARVYLERDLGDDGK